MIEIIVEILGTIAKLAVMGLVVGVAGAFIVAIIIIGYLMIANKRWE